MGCCSKIPIRFWIGVMIFFTAFTAFMIRVNISVNILSMLKSMEQRNFTPICKGNSDSKDKSDDYGNAGGTFDWDEETQSYILSAWIYGYVISCIPSGHICEQYGPYRVVLYSCGISIILNSLTVVAAKLHYGCIIVVRVLLGILGGTTYPAMSVLISNWAPPQERGKYYGCILGYTLGTVVSWEIISATSYNFGWEWGFHVIGMVLTVFLIFWFFIVADSPEKHPRISDAEKEYIKHSQEGGVTRCNRPPPFKKILTSRPVWALVWADMGNMGMVFFIANLLPKYFNEVMGFKITSSPLYAAMPYIGRFIGAILSGFIEDGIRKRKCLTITQTRKVVVCFSHLIPGITLIIVIFSGCQWGWILFLCTFNQFVNGSVVIGHLMNPMDLSPNFVGTIYGFISSFGGIAAILITTAHGFFTENSKGFDDWNKTIWLTAGNVIICGVIFICFSSGEVQSWNSVYEDEAGN